MRNSCYICVPVFSHSTILDLSGSRLNELTNNHQKWWRKAKEAFQIRRLFLFVVVDSNVKVFTQFVALLPGSEKDISFFLFLKSKFKESGAIINYPAWYPIIASDLQRSESDVRKRFASLVQMGLLTKNRFTRTARLVSWNTFCLKFKIDKTKFIRDNRFCSLTELTHLLDAYKISHNITRQHLAIDKRKRRQIRNRVLCEVISPKIAKKVCKTLMQRFYATGWDKGMRSKFSRERHKANYKPRKNSINYLCTLSTKGTAKLLGRKSASTGYRRQRILESMGLIEVKQRVLWIRKMKSIAEYFSIKTTDALDGRFRYYRKWLVKQLPNDIKFIPHYESIPTVDSII